MKRKLTYIVGGLSVIFVAAGIWQQYRQATNVKVEKVDSIFKRNIPIGSSKSDVIAFIDSARIDSLKVKDFGYQTDLSRLDHEAGIFDDKTKRLRGTLKGYLDARILDSTKTAFSQCDIRLRFYFDKDERLIDFGIRQECDGS